MRRELFIYWRVAGTAHDVQTAEATARQMQEGLRRTEPALVARLYRKVDTRGCTLMETYALPGAGVGTGLQQRIEAAAARALAPWCGEGRHVEVFEDCS